MRLEGNRSAMMNEKTMIQISVRNLVEFLLCEGDIDNRKATADKDAMQLGSKIHRKIQRQMGSNYCAEVSLKYEVPFDSFSVLVEGRADGILQEEELFYVDEIKGVFREVQSMEEPAKVHLAQAKCYAFIYAKQQQLECIGVQMTYCNMESEEIKRFREIYAFEELQKWFMELMSMYEKWARFQVEWKEKRNASVKEVTFPYTYRIGQKELVSSVYRTILRKKKLFIQAPTGVGKTISTVFPAVKAVGEGLGDKIFYLTAKTITRTVAEQAFHTMKNQGLQMKVITLTAKDKICFCEKTECNPDDCPYAKGHFDRVNDAVYDMITSTSNMSRENLENYAKKHNVCPFEMSLDVSLWVDAVICDYNYAFDPNAHLRRFFSEGKKGGYLFLIDEAHNLVERGREMYSAALYKEEFLEIKRKVKVLYPKLVRHLEACNKIMLEWKRECENYCIHETISHFALRLMNVMSELEKIMEEEKSLDEEFLDFYFHVRDFLNIYDGLDENYVIYSEMEEDGRFKVKLFCINPAMNLERYLSQGNSTILFSATLLPIHYYKKLLSVEQEDYAIYAESTFDTKQRLMVVGNDVSSKYTMRGESMYQKYAAYIDKISSEKRGNYLVFCPSYKFMEEVWNAYQKCKNPNVSAMIQGVSMSEGERETFLAEFEMKREGGLVGFCVLGGIFSEGIDLTEDRLIGAIIIGTGLPQVCNEREILKNYFDTKEENGFSYAYLYPGMNKVQQAAGRVIRTEHDKGVIALLDERFLGKQYQETFPREWKDIEVCNLQTVQEKITCFYETK